MVALKPDELPERMRDRRRSRNSVVALKHLSPLHRFSGPTAKQERRGGIETSPAWGVFITLTIGSRNAVVALKSAWIARLRPGCVREAGTPWWH